MATNDKVETLINKINTAVRGEDVRDAIIELLELANSDGVNARSLNGHSAEYFAKQADMNNIYPVDEVTEGGTRPVTSRGIYSYIHTLALSLNNIYSGSASTTAPSVQDVVRDIAEARNEIMVAISGKGVAINERTPLDDYAGLISSIVQNPEYNVIEKLSATENKTYMAEGNDVYRTVEVNVEPNLQTKTITSLGTFKPDEEYEGFSEVTVSLSSGGGGGSGDETALKLVDKSITSADLPETLPDDPIEFDPTKEEEPALGYSKVTLNLSGKIAERAPIEIDASNFGESQTFLASEDGNLYGWSKIVINIIEQEGPFTVEFWDDTGRTKIQTVSDVPKNSNVNCTATIPIPEGKMFAGWNPQPLNVTRNMSCYAIYKDRTEVLPGDEAQETWAEIGQSGGANIAIGAYKRLYYGPTTLNGVPIDGGVLYMYKVAANEEGTTSTWVSAPSGISGTNNVAWLYFNESSWNKDIKGWDDAMGNECDLKKWLNQDFRDAILAMADAQHGYGGEILNYIKPVTKYTNTIDANKAIVYDTLTTENGLWMPSAKEMNFGGYVSPPETYPANSYSGFPNNTNLTGCLRTLRAVEDVKCTISAISGYYNKKVGVTFYGQTPKNNFNSNPQVTMYNPDYVTAYNKWADKQSGVAHISRYNMSLGSPIPVGFCT